MDDVQVLFDGAECQPTGDDTLEVYTKPNLFSYKIMKRATELYEDTDIPEEEVEVLCGTAYFWSWCVNTALAEHNNAID